MTAPVPVDPAAAALRELADEFERKAGTAAEYDADIYRECAKRARALLAGRTSAPAETHVEWAVRHEFSNGEFGINLMPREDIAHLQAQLLLEPPTPITAAQVLRREVGPWVEVSPSPALSPSEEKP